MVKNKIPILITIFITYIFWGCYQTYQKAGEKSQQKWALSILNEKLKQVYFYEETYNRPPNSFEDINKIKPEFEQKACITNDPEVCEYSNLIEQKGTSYFHSSGMFEVKLISKEPRTYLKIIPTGTDEFSQKGLGGSACFNHETKIIGLYFWPNYEPDKIQWSKNQFRGQNIPLYPC